MHNSSEREAVWDCTSDMHTRSDDDSPDIEEELSFVINYHPFNRDILNHIFTFLPKAKALGLSVLNRAFRCSFLDTVEPPTVSCLLHLFTRPYTEVCIEFLLRNHRQWFSARHFSQAARHLNRRITDINREMSTTQTYLLGVVMLQEMKLFENVQIFQNLIRARFLDVCRVSDPSLFKLTEWLLYDEIRTNSHRLFDLELRTACESGNIDVARLIISDARLWFTTNSLPHVVLLKNLDLFMEMLHKTYPESRELSRDEKVDYANALEIAAREDIIELLIWMLSDTRFDPTLNYDTAIIAATKYNRRQSLSLLLRDGRCDPSAQNNLALLCAIERRNIHTAQLLLSDERVGLNDMIVWEASKDVSMLELVMERADEYYRMKYTKKMIEYVQLYQSAKLMNIITKEMNTRDEKELTPHHLISPYHVLTTICDLPDCQYALNLFMQSPSDDISPLQYTSVLERAIRKRNIEAVAALLNYPEKVNPSLNNNSCLSSACGMGELEVVQLLLKDSRVDPTCATAGKGKTALEFAIMHDHDSIAELLLNDKRTDISIFGGGVLELCAEKHKYSLLSVIMEGD